MCDAIWNTCLSYTDCIAHHTLHTQAVCEDVIRFANLIALRFLLAPIEADCLMAKRVLKFTRTIS